MPKLDHVITVTIIEILGSQEIYISVTRAFNSMSMTRLTSSVMHSQLYTILTFWLVDYLEKQVRIYNYLLFVTPLYIDHLLIGNTYLRMGNLEGDMVMGQNVFLVLVWGNLWNVFLFFLCWMYFVLFGLNY